MPIPNEIRNTLEWLLKIEEYEQARNLVQTVARYAPADSAEVSDFIAMILHRAKFYQEALPYAQKTFSLLPETATRYNLARCLQSAGEIDAAVEHIQIVIKERPEWLDPQLDQAMYICFQGHFDEAEQLLLRLQKKLSLSDPHQAVIKFNLGWHMIRRGHLKEGMDHLTIGRTLRTAAPPAMLHNRPKLEKGISLSGKKILLVGEAGAGDEIINVRFAHIIRERGGRVDWMTAQKMEGLFSRVEGIERVVQASQVMPTDYDYWAPIMDLFSILDLDEKDLLPRAYLTANPELVPKWQTRMATSKKYKIGLRWQGNPLYEQDLFRSVPFSLLRPFFSLPNCAFYSLQRDSGVDELSVTDPIQDLSRELISWEDTAAAISQLDLVITSCTSVAHLSGALGKKTWLLTPKLAYYVWAHPGHKSAWYPDVQMFRQQIFCDWTQETKNILQELRKFCK